MTKHFPIKPHLKKFVLWMLELPEPLKITERDMLGRAIIKVLQETRARRLDNAKELFTDRISVELTVDMARRSPYLHRLINVNVELDNQFAEALVVWVKAQRESGLPASTACKSFLAKLRIDESEYSFEAAWKVWLRFNESVRKKSVV